MPDSFTLPNPTPPTSASGSAAVAELKLSDVVHQQQDAIVFEGSRIPRLAGVPEAFIIFYLTEQDEQNGFGTVIQLDPATKQAAIFADLNPEYAYLFFNDEQGQLKTLLWCIEFATRTPDGLYVTQAKVRGQGVTTADMQRLSQVQVPAIATEPEHQLAEADPLPQPTHNAALPVDSFTTPQLATPAPMAPTQPMASTTPFAAEPAIPELNLPPLPQMPATPSATVAAAQAAVTPVNQTVIQPSQPAASQAQVQAPAPPPDLLTGLPTTPDTLSAPLPAPQADWNQPRPAYAEPAIQAAATDDLGLDPLLGPVESTAVDTMADPLPPITNPAQQPTSQPITAPQLKPLMPQAPASNAADKQPVGRPPKPLTQDQSWMIEPQDFTWLKQISRDPLESHKDELRQKIIKQIRKNRPGLIDDWQFHGAFEQSFQAIAQTYDLVPALRHDLLKSLLNGKVVEQVILQQQAQV